MTSRAVMARPSVASWSPLDLAPTLWLRADEIAQDDATAVASWVDLSGHGLHATQGTEASRPTLKTGIVNGHNVVRLDGSNDHLATASPAVTTQTGTMAIVCRMTTTQSSSPLTNGSIASNGLSFLTAWGSAKSVVRGGLSIDATSAAPDNDWDLLITRSRPDWYDCWSKGGAPIKSITSPGAGVITPTTSTLIGSYLPGVLCFAGDIAEVVATESALSVADLNRFVDYVNSYYGLSAEPISQLTALGIIVYDGDSQMGAVPGDGATTTSKLMALTSGSHYEVGHAQSGQTLVDIEADAAAEYDGLVDRLRNPVVVCWAGTNDMYYGASGATAFSRLSTYCASRRAAGWRVVVATALPRTDAGYPAGYEAERQAFNTAVRNGWSTIADAMFDCAADTRIGDAGDELNTTYYHADRVHLLAAGRDIIAAGFYAALGTLGLT